MSGVIVDTSPIVAILSKSDSYHKQCVEALKYIQPPMFTTWLVITEAQYLLRKDKVALKGLFLAFKSGLFTIEELPADALFWLEKFLIKYADNQAQIADASLMYLADIKKINTVFTLDKKDFSIYRLKNKKTVNILPI